MTTDDMSRREPPRQARAIYFFDNGNIAAFDKPYPGGEQMPELQKYTVKRDDRVQWIKDRRADGLIADDCEVNG